MRREDSDGQMSPPSHDELHQTTGVKGLAMYEGFLGPGHLAFPPDFILGASTAAYQIEGGATEGGRGPSIWDIFSHTPGKTEGGATGDVAADHYHRVETDLVLMASLNLDAYRFSISWSRVMPTGEGEVNPEGLAFYSRLVDGLLSCGIQPIATLNHWDLPQALEDRYGGWRGRQTAFAFEKYAEIVGAALGDRVAIWSTHNEPWNNSFSGYGSGAFAPGGTSHADALQAAHHLNLAHGLGVMALRRTVTRPDARISVTLNIFRIQAEKPRVASTPWRTACSRDPCCAASIPPTSWRTPGPSPTGASYSRATSRSAISRSTSSASTTTKSCTCAWIPPSTR
jgi:beta-glucosidase